VSPRALALDIVTPDGTAVEERDLDAIVFHRRERLFEVGSEIAVFPLHAPMLVRLPIAPVRFRRGEEIVHLALRGGFAQVLADRVLIATPRVERIPTADATPLHTAREVCRGWEEEVSDFREEMTGYS